MYLMLQNMWCFYLSFKSIKPFSCADIWTLWRAEKDLSCIFPTTCSECWIVQIKKLGIHNQISYDVQQMSNYPNKEKLLKWNSVLNPPTNWFLHNGSGNGNQRQAKIIIKRTREKEIVDLKWNTRNTFMYMSVYMLKDKKYKYLMLF